MRNVDETPQRPLLFMLARNAASNPLSSLPAVQREDHPTNLSNASRLVDTAATRPVSDDPSHLQVPAAANRFGLPVVQLASIGPDRRAPRGVVRGHTAAVVEAFATSRTVATVARPRH